MRGMVGIITAISNKFKNLENDTIKSIRAAIGLEREIEEQLRKQATKKTKKTPEKIDPVQIVSDIKGDMSL